MTDDYASDYDFERDVDYQAELVKLAIAEMLAGRMEQLNISRTELARRLGVTRARVTQILAGYSNLTVGTLAAAAAALEARVYVELVPSVARGAASPPNVEGWKAPPRRLKGCIEQAHDSGPGGLSAMERLRLRNAHPAPLALHGFWVDEVHLLRTPLERASDEEDAEVGVRASKPKVLVNPEDPSQYFVRLRVKATGAGQSVDVTASGLFRVAEGGQGPEESNRLVQYNAPAILYGMVRGIVASLTGSSDSGRLDLPAINILQLADD